MNALPLSLSVEIPLSNKYVFKTNMNQWILFQLRRLLHERANHFEHVGISKFPYLYHTAGLWQLSFQQKIGAALNQYVNGHGNIPFDQPIIIVMLQQKCAPIYILFKQAADSADQKFLLLQIASLYQDWSTNSYEQSFSQLQIQIKKKSTENRNITRMYTEIYIYINN